MNREPSLPDERPSLWPEDMPTYLPELDDGKTLIDRISGPPGVGLFCPEDSQTDIHVMEAESEKTEVRSSRWNCERMKTALKENPHFRLLYVNMVKVEGNNRLAISASIFRELASSLQLPPAFANSLMKYRDTPLFHGSRMCGAYLRGSDGGVFDMWHVIRVRTSMHCTGTHHQYQMNPFNLLHLELGGKKTDIPSFEFGVFFRYDSASKQTTVFCANTASPKLKVLGAEFESLVTQVFKQTTSTGRPRGDPFWIHVAYIGLALRHWKSTLTSFQQELIHHDERIEDFIQAYGSNDRKGSQDTSFVILDTVGIHSMTSHCLRYETEISSIVKVIEEILLQHEKCKHLFQDSWDFEPVHRSLQQRLAEAKGVLSLQSELAEKTKNTLAFLFHALTSAQETLQTSNGHDLKQILELSQQDVKQTIVLTKQMWMVAFIQMLFLPAATIAAVLSMPIFETKWPKNGLWIWGGSTMGFTGTLLVIYFTYGYFAKKNREEKLEEIAVTNGGSVRGSFGRDHAIYGPENGLGLGVQMGNGETEKRGLFNSGALPMYSKVVARVHRPR